MWFFIVRCAKAQVVMGWALADTGWMAALWRVRNGPHCVVLTKQPLLHYTEGERKGQPTQVQKLRQAPRAAPPMEWVLSHSPCPFSVALTPVNTGKWNFLACLTWTLSFAGSLGQETAVARDPKPQSVSFRITPQVLALSCHNITSFMPLHQICG
jgi:hypothetical protein